jgi:hypothetical protein
LTYLAERIPDAKLHAFEGKGHLPIFTATTAFGLALRAFGRGEAGPGPGLQEEGAAGLERES